MGSLISTIFYINFAKGERDLNENIFAQMRICNFDLKCEKFKIDFVIAGKDAYYVLHKNEDGLYANFPISGAKKNILKVQFVKENYEKELWLIKKELLIEYIFMIIIVLILSFIFSYLSLSPLRKSLELTQEFVKDILHDFNTPLSTLRLNASMLKREIAQNDKLDRIEKSVSSVLELQSHLRSYLNNTQGEKENFNLLDILKENILLLENNHPELSFHTELSSCELYTFKDSFVRIVDNLLSNAVKYNKHNGSISIIYDKSKKILHIIDTGRGIKYPNKVFERFYKEQERGIGIGLNIVKKLCEELGINISVKSTFAKGSTFSLHIKSLLV